MPEIQFDKYSILRLDKVIRICFSCVSLVKPNVQELVNGAEGTLLS